MLSSAARAAARRLHLREEVEERPQALVPIVGDDKIAEAHEHVVAAGTAHRLVEGEGGLGGIASAGMPVTCWTTATKLSSSRILPSPLTS
jgi:hypothetical protein